MFPYINYYLDSPENTIECVDALPDDLKESGNYQILKGYAYLELIGTSPDFETNEEYKNKAYEALKTADSAGFSLSEKDLLWMSEYESEREN